MSRPAEQDDNHFALKRPPGVSPALYIVGGLAACGLGLLLFGLQLLLPPEKQSAFPVVIMTVVAPSLVGVGLISQGWRLSRRVTGVTFDAVGLTVATAGGRRTVPWAEIARVEPATIQQFGGFTANSLEAVHLFGHDGRRLVTVTDELEDFTDLRERLTAKLAEQVGPEAAVPSGRRPRKGIAVVYGLFAVFLTVAYIFVAFDTRSEQVNQELLAADGMTVDATVVKHEMFMRAPRVEYRFAAEDGVAHERGAVLTQANWQALAGRPYPCGTSVPTRSTAGCFWVKWTTAHRLAHPGATCWPWPASR